ncbi:hypothetical protein [Lichenihabitans sp. PAMC28606]|uniref:hypothetical protein n=1 Tax=Lichenihabitans sp. PAMC28606 TaxID=2880932 RepID=UPI0039B4E02F
MSLADTPDSRWRNPYELLQGRLCENSSATRERARPDRRRSATWLCRSKCQLHDREARRPERRLSGLMLATAGDPCQTFIRPRLSAGWRLRWRHG